MVRGSKAHVILICEAGSLKHYEKYLAEFGWTNAENRLFLAGLGEEGSIQQIAGPREDYASKFVQDNLWKTRMQSLSSSGERPYQGKSLLHPGIVVFTLETMTHAAWLQQELVFIMSTMKMQVNHMQSREWLAAMLYECFVHRVATIGDANEMAHQRQGLQPNCS